MSEKVLRCLTLWIPVAFWCAVIYWLSSIPNLRFVEGPWDFWIRKVGHAGVYAILARLLARALTGTTFWPWRRIFAISLVFSFLYAGSDEYHQRFTVGRSASIHDVAIDTLGAWIALGMTP
jgi:hypothetical protein